MATLTLAAHSYVLFVPPIIAVQWNLSNMVTMGPVFFKPLWTGGRFIQVILHKLGPGEVAMIRRWLPSTVTIVDS